MKNNDFEKKIKASFDAEAPDLLARIEESCRREVQEPPLIEEEMRRTVVMPAPRRIVAAVLCLILFVGGVLVGRVTRGDGDGAPVAPDTFVYIDVNPSIEISVNAENRVVECTAANDDAAELLADLSLVGVELNTAVSAVVGAMFVNGYLNDSANSILVSVDAPDEQRTDALIGEITSRINRFFDGSSLKCSIIAQGVSTSEELKSRAKENGVSVGKMHLVDKMLDGIDELQADDALTLAGMSIRELNFIYSSHKGKGETDKFDKDTVIGSAGGYLGEHEIEDIVAQALGIGLSSLDEIDIKASLYGEGAERKPVYSVTVKLSTTELSYHVKLDCVTGEVLYSNLDTGGHQHAGQLPSLPDFPLGGAHGNQENVSGH